MKVEISKILISETRRAVDPESVSRLADSIKDIGLLNPITVTSGNRLIAGAHRLEACRMLGWLEIDINVVDLDNLQAELAEIDENLIRNELHFIKRGEQLSRRKDIYEVLHPEQ